MKRTIKLVSLFMCLIMLVGAVSCASKGKAIMTVGEKSLSVNTYQFLLSRMKGTLKSYGYDVDNESFWKTIISADGMTYNDYFCANIMEQASRYVIAEHLFDKNGLTLTDDREEIVDGLMDKLVERAGSKNALNASLKEFGVNYKTLRDIYILETKIDMLKDHLYGDKGEKVSVEDKEEYLNSHYVAFGQMLIAGYYYIIDKDNFGDNVYYTDEKHTAIAYDTVNGKTKTDEFGLEKKDIFGKPEYYTEDGRIAYDKSKGVLGYTYDKSGNKLTAPYDDEKLAELYATSSQYALDADGDIEKFKELAKKHGEGEKDGDIMYLFSEAGYYAAQHPLYAYLDSITKELSKMEVGECRVVKATVEDRVTYHVIFKYEIEEGVYDSEAQKDVFSDFYEGVVAYLFEEECKKYESQIRIDQAVADSAPDMISVGANTLY